MNKLKTFWNGLNRPFTAKDYAKILLAGLGITVVYLAGVYAWYLREMNKIKNWHKETENENETE